MNCNTKFVLFMTQHWCKRNLVLYQSEKLKIQRTIMYFYRRSHFDLATFSSLHMKSITDFSSFEAKLWDFCATLWFIIRIYLYVHGKFRDKWAWEHCGCSNGPTWPNFWQNWQNTSGIQLSDKIHFEFKFIFLLHLSCFGHIMRLTATSAATGLWPIALPEEW